MQHHHNIHNAICALITKFNTEYIKQWTRSIYTISIIYNVLILHEDVAVGIFSLLQYIPWYSCEMLLAAFNQIRLSSNTI